MAKLTMAFATWTTYSAKKAKLQHKEFSKWLFDVAGSRKLKVEVEMKMEMIYLTTSHLSCASRMPLFKRGIKQYTSLQRQTHPLQRQTLDIKCYCKTNWMSGMQINLKAS